MTMATPSVDERRNLFGLERAELENFFVSCGEKPFRGRQFLRWLCHGGVADFQRMTDFSLELRQRLAERAHVRIPSFESESRAADGVVKWGLGLPDGAVETVFIPSPRRGTLCVSSQIGCALKCSFCATGRQGWRRDLSVAEIFAQLWRAHESLEAFAPGSGRRISNVVFMGMGEPLLNFDNVTAAARLMLDDLGFGLAKRRVTISTAGVAPRIERLAEEAKGAALAVSLHAADDALRSELVPINRKYPLADLMEACRAWLRRLNEPRRTVGFEYTLLAGVNDSLAQARDLRRLLAGMRCKINLIPFNDFDGGGYRRPSPRQALAFRDVLTDGGFCATLRATRGDDIDAACGQLVGRVIRRRSS